MLVLTRKVGDSVIMGKNGEIKITILGVVGTQVRLGFLADKDIPINREEIANKIMNEKIKSILNQED